MPRVLNKRTATKADLNGAVYIGRPSKWGNPFKLANERARDETIQFYRDWLATTPIGQRLAEQAKRELRGKNLVCWCASRACHGDVLLEIANAGRASGRKRDDMSEPTYAELLDAARQYREACCAAMRVIAEIDSATAMGLPAADYQQRFVDELHSIGITNGFGKRCDDVLKRAAAAPAPPQTQGETLDDFYFDVIERTIEELKYSPTPKAKMLAWLRASRAANSKENQP